MVAMTTLLLVLIFQHDVSYEEDLIDVDDADISVPLSTTELTIKPGDRLQFILPKYKISNNDLISLQKQSGFQDAVANLRPGQVLEIVQNQSNDLVSLSIIYSPYHRVEFTKEDVGFSVRDVNLTRSPKEQVVKNIKIERSLYEDALSQGLSPALIAQLSQIFGWQVNVKRGSKRRRFYSNL